MVHSSEEFEDGWIVAEAKRYSLEDNQRRGYELRPDKKLLKVNTMVRLNNLHFTGSRGGARERR